MNTRLPSLSLFYVLSCPIFLCASDKQPTTWTICIEKPSPLAQSESDDSRTPATSFEPGATPTSITLSTSKKSAGEEGLHIAAAELARLANKTPESPDLEKNKETGKLLPPTKRRSFFVFPPDAMQNKQQPEATASDSLEITDERHETQKNLCCSLLCCLRSCFGIVT